MFDESGHLQIGCPLTSTIRDSALCACSLPTSLRQSSLPQTPLIYLKTEKHMYNCFKNIPFNFFMCVCICVCTCHHAYVGIGGQLLGVCSLLSPCGVSDQTQVISLGGKYPSHLMGPQMSLLFKLSCYAQV